MIIFISDLHLSPKTNNNNQLFYSLLKAWQEKADALYILGDFFDYWLGDDDNNEFIAEIKQNLKSFTHHKPIYFIRGNHDFAVGKKFAHETGITLLPEHYVVNLQGKKILLTHGDSFCTLDINYQRMKKIIQNPLIVAILRRTPLSWRYKIKEFLEHKSSQTFHNQASTEIYKVTKESIVEATKKYKVGIIIHGHTHKPGLYNIHDKSLAHEILRVELPDWVDRNPGGYVCLSQGNFIITL